MTTPEPDALPVIPVIYRFIYDELIAILPTLPGSYGLDSLDALAWADGFVSVDLAYAALGEPAGETAYNNMHSYLVKRFADDANLEIIAAIQTRHHEERHARLRASIEALQAGAGSPPWSPEGLAALRKSADALISGSAVPTQLRREDKLPEDTLHRQVNERTCQQRRA